MTKLAGPMAFDGYDDASGVYDAYADDIVDASFCCDDNDAFESPHDASLPPSFLQHHPQQPPVQQQQQQQQQLRNPRSDTAEGLCIADETRRKSVKTTSTVDDGFVTADGTRRKYDAPEPPRKQLNWDLLLPVLRGTVTWREETDLCIMMDKQAARDAWELKDTRASVRETLELIRPFFVCRSFGGWLPEVETELRYRGIKLADSFVVHVANTERFGVRAFHVSFRFFVLVILGGTYDAEQHEFEDVGGRPIIGIYLVALSRQEAISNRCV